jgi:hypothetical protein
MNLLKHQTYYDIYDTEFDVISNQMRTLMRSSVDEYILIVIDDDISFASELLHENINFSLNDTLKEYGYTS